MDKLLVIKIGGHIIDDETKLSSFLKQFADVKEKKILVHGGGKLATKIGEQLGIKQKLVDGRRITDTETLKIVTMVYAGYINKNIVAQLQAYGCDAVGLSGADGNSILAHKRKVQNTSSGDESVDYGLAGDIDKINSKFLQSLLNQGSAVVIAPITHDKNGQLLNTNADTIAQEVATGMSDNYDVALIYSFEKSGVLLDIADDNTAIPLINLSSFGKLKADQKISDGMIPKLDNAFKALNKGVTKIIIGRAEELKELINGKKGTTIVND